MNKHMVKKEFHESLYDSKGLWMIVAVSGILTALCILVVSIKEGSVLAQNDILQYAIKAVLFLTLTVAMVLGASSMIAEREENTLESLLLTPISKKNIVLAKYMGVILIGEILFAASVPYLTAIGFGSGIGAAAVFITFFGGSLLLTAFVALSMVLSILMKSSKASVLTSILIMIVLTLPAMIQGIFKLSAVGNFILKINPVAGCFDMMTKLLTDRASFFLLGNYIFSLALFAALSLGLLFFTSEKIALKGEQ